MAQHEMKIRVIKTISEDTKEIIKRRTRNQDLTDLFQKNSALAIIHSDVCEMIYFSDLACKTSDVKAFEIPGSCPQHMACLGILGDVAAVESAVQRIKSEVASSKEDYYNGACGRIK